MKNDSRTSLEKSHSALSNTKLTLICLLASVAFAGFFATLGLKSVLPGTVFTIALVASVGLSVLTAWLIRRFTR